MAANRTLITEPRSVAFDPQSISISGRGSRQRIGVIIERIPGLPPGGSEAVGFWTVEALKSDYDVAIISADADLSLPEVNAFFGTRILSNEVDFIVAPVPPPVRDAPRLRLLTKHFIARYCRKIAVNFDLLIGTASEMDLGVQGIQYIHYPLALSQGRNKILAAYSFLSGIIAGYSHRRMTFNWTLANSKWTAQKAKDAYGIDALVLYPPVADDALVIPWSDREDGFVCIGRISPDKNLESVVRIVKSVRQEAPGVHLHLIGEIRDRSYWKRIAPLLASEKDWLFYEGRLPRDGVIRLVGAHKYGIHGMPEEHFGIGVAEMAKAGCLVFVPRGGGQVEIVQSEDLVYDNESDAVRKIHRVMKEQDRQSALRNALAERAGEFSSKKFMLDMRALVIKFLDARITPGPANSNSGDGELRQSD